MPLLRFHPSQLHPRFRQCLKQLTIGFISRRDSRSANAQISCAFTAMRKRSSAIFRFASPFPQALWSKLSDYCRPGRTVERQTAPVAQTAAMTVRSVLLSGRSRSETKSKMIMPACILMLDDQTMAYTKRIGPLMLISRCRTTRVRLVL